jgi:hypothetical protein
MSTENVSEQSNNETIESMGFEPNQKEFSQEEKARMEEIKELVDAESLDPTTSMNIIINAVQACFDSEMFNDLDRYLIAKSLNCFKGYVERGEDLVIKVSES